MEHDSPHQTDSLPPPVPPHSDAAHDDTESVAQNETQEEQLPEVTYTKEEDSLPETVQNVQPEEHVVNGTIPVEEPIPSPPSPPEAVPANGHVAADPENNIPPPTPPKVVQPLQTSPRKDSVPNARFPEATNASRPDIRAGSPSLSVASAGSLPAHRRSMTISKGHNVSMVLITTALETISASKEARRSAPLRDSTTNALELIRSNQGGDKPREIFEPLRLACETRNEKLMVASLDCISKLISYSFFTEEDSASAYASPPPSPSPAGRNAAGASQTNIPLPSLVDLVAHTITSCHTESTPDPVSLQIVKALLSLVLSPTILVHHSSLLKAVRTVYNIFLLSTDPVNQMVAQGGLTQMVHHVFTRCRRNVKSATEPHNQQSLSSTRESFALDRSEDDSRSSLNEQTESTPNEADVNGDAEGKLTDSAESRKPADLPAKRHLTLYVILLIGQISSFLI
jgi:brefeldin A-inhibited guanine nucleotide-exchange protein